MWLAVVALAEAAGPDLAPSDGELQYRLMLIAEQQAVLVPAHELAAYTPSA